MAQDDSFDCPSHLLLPYAIEPPQLFKYENHIENGYIYLYIFPSILGMDDDGSYLGFRKEPLKLPIRLFHNIDSPNAYLNPIPISFSLPNLEEALYNYGPPFRHYEDERWNLL